MTALPPSGPGALLGLLALTALTIIGAIIHAHIERRARARRHRYLTGTIRPTQTRQAFEPERARTHGGRP